MRKFALILALSAVAASAQAASHKAAAKPAAPKSEAAKPIDARDPAALMGVLAGMGAKSTAAKSPAGRVLVTIETPGGGFGLQFVDCDAAGKACHGLAFSTAFDRKGATLAQLNSFNRDQVVCRGFLGEDGRPNIVYSTLLSPRMSTEDLKEQIGVWQGCLATFAEFTTDPAAFLAKPD
jgi:glucose/arabinose dehydrogenase